MASNGGMHYHRTASRGDDDESDFEEISAAQPNTQAIVANKISLPMTYFLCITLGIVGTHHYYLSRRIDGLLYTATLGFFGIGWIVDWFRLPSLVEATNKKRKEEAEAGYAVLAVPYGELEERSIITAYLYCIPPWGFFGIHHMYLGTFRGNEIFQLVYAATLGLLGIGWLIDIFCIPMTVRRANQEIQNLRSGKPVSAKSSDTIHLDTAYVLAFPLGIFGLHHFYLRRHVYGMIYAFTFGLAGFGVLIDLIRLPNMFRRNKQELRELKYSPFHVDDVYMLWFPLGILGLHHFYMRRWLWGMAYLLTFGMLGVGWLIDGFRMRSLVEGSNKKVGTGLIWESHVAKVKKQHANANIFVNKKLYQFPATDEDGNIQVYAFPLKPDGRLSWLFGWPWSPTVTNENVATIADDSVGQSQKHKTPLAVRAFNMDDEWSVNDDEITVVPQSATFLPI